VAELKDEISVVYSRDQAIKSATKAGLKIERIALSLVRNWHLKVTTGSKIRALRFTPGKPFRMRLGKYRIVFTKHYKTVCIHLVEPRDKVYEIDAFHKILKVFEETMFSSKELKKTELEKLNYAYLKLEDGTKHYPTNDPDWSTSIYYYLSPRQQDFFNTVLPIRSDNPESNPRLIIGYGPPGSGKTIVSIDLAIETFLDGNSVDILVPSAPLKDEYNKLFVNSGITTVSCHDGSPNVRVQQFTEFFERRANKNQAPDRENSVLNWARNRLETPSWKNKLQANSSDIDPRKVLERIPILIDTLVEDEVWWTEFSNWSSRTRDPIIESILPYMQIVEDMREGLLDSLQEDHNSSHLTRGALANLPSKEDDNPARLVIIDEAQDLAPAEWRALINDAFVKNKDNDQRIVFLGDLRQRVNIVPFSWEDLKNFARTECGVSIKEISDLQIDNTSYRMSREVALAAASVFEKEVRPPGKFRSPGVLDPDLLPSGGKVTVAIIDNQPGYLNKMLGKIKAPFDIGEYLFVVHGRDLCKPLSGRSEIINYSIKEAKGLEADSVVVHLPFGSGIKDARLGIIPHDDATEFYTAFSRARQRVLLILDKETWSILSKANTCWEGSEIKSFDSSTDAFVIKALEAAFVGLTSDQALATRISQLEAVVNSPNLLPEEVKNTISEVLCDLVRIADEDISFTLLEHGRTLSISNPNAFSSIKSWYLAERGKLSDELNVAFLLLFGELAAATAYIKNMSPCENFSWDLSWLELLRDDNKLQSQMAAYFAKGSNLIWSDEYTETIIMKEIINILDTSIMRKPTALRSDFLKLLEEEQLQKGSIQTAADIISQNRAGDLISSVSNKLRAIQSKALQELIEHNKKRTFELEKRLKDVEENANKRGDY
jgi:hypothetical protein